MTKSRAWKQARHTKQVHKRVVKQAKERNRGLWETLSGEQKHCAVKMAMKRTMTAGFDSKIAVPPPMHDSEVFGKPMSVHKFLPSWLELRPKSIEPEPIESEEAA
jgi:hypothetical protein